MVVNTARLVLVSQGKDGLHLSAGEAAHNLLELRLGHVTVTIRIEALESRLDIRQTIETLLELLESLGGLGEHQLDEFLVVNLAIVIDVSLLEESVNLSIRASTLRGDKLSELVPVQMSVTVQVESSEGVLQLVNRPELDLSTRGRCWCGGLRAEEGRELRQADLTVSVNVRHGEDSHHLLVIESQSGAVQSVPQFFAGNFPVFIDIKFVEGVSHALLALEGFLQLTDFVSGRWEDKLGELCEAQSSVLVGVSQSKDSCDLSSGESLSGSALQLCDCDLAVSIRVKPLESHFDVRDGSQSGPELGQTVGRSWEESADKLHQADLPVLVEVGHGEDAADLRRDEVHAGAGDALEQLGLGERAVVIGIKPLECDDGLRDVPVRK